MRIAELLAARLDGPQRRRARRTGEPAARRVRADACHRADGTHVSGDRRRCSLHTGGDEDSTVDVGAKETLNEPLMRYGRRDGRDKSFPS